MPEKPNHLPDSGADSKAARSEERGGANPAADRTIRLERTFDAPRELVFDAWTDPKYLLRWFAPGGCSLRFLSIDVRRGGSFHSCISNPSFECWCVGTYLEISRPERLVYTMAVADRHGNKVASAAAGHDSQWPPETTVVVTFEEVDGKTHLTLHQDVSETLARKTGAYPSWLDMLDRLNELLLTTERENARPTPRRRASTMRELDSGS